MRFWDPLQNPMGSKMAPKIDQWAPKGVKKANYVRRSCITWSQSLPRRLLKCSQAFCSAFWHDLRSLLDKFWLNVNVSLYYIEASGTHAVSVPETTLRPRRRLKRFWSHLSWFLKDLGSLPGLIFDDFQWLLAPLLALNSGTRQKRHAPDTIQNTCSELVRNFKRRGPARKLQKIFGEQAKTCKKCKEPTEN